MALHLSPRRLLIISPPQRLPYSPSPLPSLLHALTGVRPAQDQVASGFAGYTQHPPLQLRTKYYDADVGIWCDEAVPWSAEATDAVKIAGAEAPESASHVPISSQPSPIQAHNTISLSSARSGAAELQQAASADGGSGTNAPPSLSTWRATMLSEPAGEVREAVGGIVLALPLPIFVAGKASTSSSKHSQPEIYLELIEAVDEVRQMIEEENAGREIAAVALVTATGKGVGQADLQATAEKLEAAMQEERGIFGWEFVGWDGQVGEDDVAGGRSPGLRNAFGELMGIERVKELLAAVDWSAARDGPGDPDLDAGFLSSEDEGGSFSVDAIKLQGQELEREMMGLKLAMLKQDTGEDDAPDEHEASLRDAEDDEDVKISQLPGLMERVIAVRDAGADMSKTEREKLARREVEKIMRDLR